MGLSDCLLTPFLQTPVYHREQCPFRDEAMKSPVLPVYEVEYLPVERRLGERRRNPQGVWPPAQERRRGERRKPEPSASLSAGA